MPRFAPVFAAMILCTTLAACGPSAAEVATMTATAWTDTPTATATATATSTPTPTVTPTATPTTDLHQQEMQKLLESNAQIPYFPDDKKEPISVGQLYLDRESGAYMLAKYVFGAVEGVQLISTSETSNPKIQGQASEILVVDLVFPDDTGKPFDVGVIVGAKMTNGFEFMSMIDGERDRKSFEDMKSWIAGFEGKQMCLLLWYGIEGSYSTGFKWGDPNDHYFELFLSVLEDLPQDEMIAFMSGRNGHKLPDGVDLLVTDQVISEQYFPVILDRQ